MKDFIKKLFGKNEVAEQPETETPSMEAESPAGSGEQSEEKMM